MKTQIDKKPGFSLIEIIVAVGIVALIAVAATLSYSSQRVRGRETKRIEDVSEMATALRSYEAMGKKIPVVSAGTIVDTALVPLVTAGIINDIPRDPLPGGVSSPPLCINYQYDDSASSSEVFGSSTVGTRTFYIAFGSEVRPEGTTNTHPYNNAVFHRPVYTACNSSRWVGILWGDRK